MEVEQWSLVQAYGLADLGTGGFFTMRHKVCALVWRVLVCLYALALCM